LENWLGALKNDKTLIVKAAGKAQKAGEFIIGKDR
jgi:antirestriction protein ArdC